MPSTPHSTFHPESHLLCRYLGKFEDGLRALRCDLKPSSSSILEAIQLECIDMSKTLSQFTDTLKGYATGGSSSSVAVRSPRCSWCILDFESLAFAFFQHQTTHLLPKPNEFRLYHSRHSAPWVANAHYTLFSFNLLAWQSILHQKSWKSFFSPP